MTVWYLLSLPAVVVIMLTAIARLNDVTRTQTGIRWNVRRAGLFSSAIFAIVFIAAPFTESGRELPVSWVTMLGLYGWAKVWLTTPGMPPWDVYIIGLHRQPKTDGTDAPLPNKSLGGLITKELIALRNSFFAQGDIRSGVERRSGQDRRKQP